MRLEETEIRNRMELLPGWQFEGGALQRAPLHVCQGVSTTTKQDALTSPTNQATTGGPPSSLILWVKCVRSA